MASRKRSAPDSEDTTGNQRQTHHSDQGTGPAANVAAAADTDSDAIASQRREFLTTLPAPVLMRERNILKRKAISLKAENKEFVEGLMKKHGYTFAIAWKRDNDPRAEPFLKSQEQWFVQYNSVLGEISFIETLLRRAP